MTTFSIIAPIYNVEPYIEKCIKSILAQTYKDFELICVDDCGTDSSMKIVEKYAKEDSRIKIYRHKKNMGPAAARNTALDNAKGKYIFCIDTDDWIDPDTLKIINYEFKTKNVESIWINGVWTTGLYNSSENPLYNNKETGYISLYAENLPSFHDVSWMKAFTLESIKRHNLRWPEDIRLNEDGLFYYKYYTYNPVVYFINNCLYYHRKRQDSEMDKFYKAKYSPTDFFEIVKKVRDFWIEVGCYEQYKTALLKMTQNRIFMCKHFYKDKKYIKMALDFINDMQFPNDYQKFVRDRKPLVSIVVPVYNVEKYIEQCLRSIMTQNYKNIEIICVDDCGTDSSMDIVRRLRKEDKRIKIYKNDRNRGAGGCRTNGLKHAKGEYFMSIDSDDWILQDCIKTCVEKMNETGLNSVWFKADYWFEDKQKKAPINFAAYFMNMTEGYLRINPNEILTYPLIIWNKMYRMDFLRKNNFSWRENVIYDDNEFCFKLYTLSPETYIIDRHFYMYRQWTGSAMQGGYRDKERSRKIYDVATNVYKYLKENNLFEKYKCTFIVYIKVVLCMFINILPLDKLLKTDKLKFLNNVNFPEEYKEFEQLH